MSNKVIKFYKKDAAIEPDAVLEQAIGKYESVIVIGWDKDGNLDPRVSLNISQRDIHWLLSIFQHKLLNGDYSSEETI
jgi:hypothetical protein